MNVADEAKRTADLLVQTNELLAGLLAEMRYANRRAHGVDGAGGVDGDPNSTDTFYQADMVVRLAAIYNELRSAPGTPTTGANVQALRAGLGESAEPAP